MLRNNPEERRSHLLREGSLQSYIKVASSEKGVLLPLVALAHIWDCLVVAKGLSRYPLRQDLTPREHSTAGISWQSTTEAGRGEWTGTNCVLRKTRHYFGNKSRM